MVETGGPAAPIGAASPGGAAGEVEVSLEGLQDYVNRTLLPLQDRMTRISADFGSMPMYRDMYGPIPAARELDQRNWDAYEVYAPTVRALSDDLNLLISKLGTVIKNYSDQEANVADDLIRLGNKLSGDSGYQATAVYETNSREQIQQSAGSGAAAPASSAPASPAPAAPSPQPATTPATPAPTPTPTHERGF